jgi:hypothetical protein
VSESLKVYRSGSILLFGLGKFGLMVSPGTGWSGQPALLESILAHCNVADDWVFLEPGAFDRDHPALAAKARDILTTRSHRP